MPTPAIKGLISTSASTVAPKADVASTVTSVFNNKYFASTLKNHLSVILKSKPNSFNLFPTSSLTLIKLSCDLVINSFAVSSSIA